MKNMTRNELQALCDNARQWDKMLRAVPRTDAAIMVLELMDTEEYANNYCDALREVLNAFPEINREALETELDKFI